MNNLRVLIHGTGFAGQGHTAAFRYAGAEVVGIVGRTPHVTQQVAQDLSIPYASTDWARALADCQPDVVSIGTPGGAHEPAIRQALEHGCHVFCDKPLTADGDSAEALCRLAEEKQLKTAYAASYRYMPHVLHAQRLVADGAIGEPQEVECISHFGLDKNIPFGWSHRREDGGGRLNNNFTHKLSIVTAVLGDTILAIQSDTRDDLGRAPIVKGVHNFKTRRDFIPEDLDDPNLAWGESNVEWSYTVLAKLQSALAREPVSVLFKHGGLQPRFHENHIVFYGSRGAIYIKGHYAAGPLYHYGDDRQWTERPVPADLLATLPDIEDDTLRNWAYLAREFVKDLRGEDAAAYQTFRDGSRYQRLIDLIRSEGGWVDVS